jgi:hypothetical protein
MIKGVNCRFFSLNTIFLFVSFLTFSQVTLEKEVKITDFGLHFNGSKVGSGVPNTGDNAPYDFYFGRNISAHGDCIKTYGDYVFVTWYKGGKEDRHVMLTRYNTVIGTMATIEFPHRHTGFQNQYWIGESHNTIAVAVSPLDGTIHLLYDMHAYSRTRPSNGGLSKDYFRYSYSLKDVASLPDEDFTLDKFVKNSNGGYKHLSLNGGEDYSNFAALTYPQFFLNDGGDLFMYMREGGNNNGAYKFSKYDASTSKWSDFTHFNVLNAKRQSGVTYNWGLYGNMKYVNGKIRIGFQRRSANNSDKYQYQNGVYYAYSDDQNGFTNWKNHSGEMFSLPLFDADKIKVMEPGDYVRTTQTSKVHIVGSFDWTVTENGDVHIINRVRDNQYNETKYLHTYKPAGADNFNTSEDFAGGSAIYTSGGSVYIVGLKNNRVFVQKTEGGTNNFKTVYQANSGRSFDHGRVHINNGKLYYYLMERKTGSAQPLYLQIIDLDIKQEPFRVSLTSPFSEQTYTVDETIQISANAINQNGNVTKVEFTLNGDYLGEDATEPYSTNWTPLTEGAFTIQAIAYNDKNETVSSSVRTINTKIFDPTELVGKTYRLKNVATKKYLKVSEANVVESDYEAQNNALNWKFVKTSVDGIEYYNIDSEQRGILRATGAGVDYTIISTTKEPPSADVDKVWNVYYNEDDNTYRFEARSHDRYLYHQNDGAFYNLNTEDTNSRNKWILELANEAPLNVKSKEIDRYSVNIYPNPTKDNFTFFFKGLLKVNMKIYDILGKVVYEKQTSKQSISIENNNKFSSGIYMVKIIGDNKKVLNTKLIID